MDTELAKRIGRATRKARVNLGLSQADAAERIGISLEFFGRIERGTTSPSVPTLVAMATALHVSADVLLGLEEGQRLRVTPTAIEPRSPQLRALLRRIKRAEPKTIRVLNVVAAALVGQGTKRHQKARS
jgi:transcriptional regulator with XRE-family HTH domain